MMQYLNPRPNNSPYEGSHILVDYNGIAGDENEIGKFIFDLMIETIEQTTMKIVHKQLSILNVDTPPGFTAILLLDSSHFSCHSYSDTGLLAIDLFTCGPTNTFTTIEYFTKRLFEKFPNAKCTYKENHKRFRHTK